MRERVLFLVGAILIVACMIGLILLGSGHAPEPGYGPTTSVAP